MITSTLGEFGISIDSMLQKPVSDEGRAKLLFTTHKTQEAKMREAMQALEALDVVEGKIAMMRIEK